MKAKSLVTAAVALTVSVAMVTAFSTGDTGTRNVTASVVNDADAFIAMEANQNNVYNDFVSTSGGKLSVSFDSAATNSSGSGINPGSTYEWDAIINITNKASSSLTVDVTISGTDSTLCQVALTGTEAQASGDYSANPTALSVAKDAKAYLGLKMDGTGKVSGGSVSCTIKVTA